MLMAQGRKGFVMRWLGLIVVVAIAGLALWRGYDHLADRRFMAALRAHAPSDPPRFDPSMIADLPEPARRYLSFAIAPGTPLTSVVELEMDGVFRLGTQDAPRELAMHARQIHAPPHGFLWKMRAGAGVMRVSGADSHLWTRFWAEGLIPVARVADTPDHHRSAMGRLFIEAVVWTPASALPGPGVRWEAPGPDTARVIFTQGAYDYAVDLALLPSGQPVSGTLQRWSDANPDKTYRLQTFGGALAGYETHDGFTIPTEVAVGHFFGTPDFFPFFEAKLTDVRFLP